MAPIFFWTCTLLLAGCQSRPGLVKNEPIIEPSTDVIQAVTPSIQVIPWKDSAFKTIHVLVALCDNQYQGIVPVPPKIGNGQDPDNNLYWGCGYGIRTFFKKSAEWQFLGNRRHKKDTLILETLLFKHRTQNYYLLAEAYNGKYIRECTRDFLYACAGTSKDTFQMKGKVIPKAGNADLLAYIGHDGLMEFHLEEDFSKKDSLNRTCIILACTSRDYFGPYISSTGAQPLVWTTGLMCPEAYTLHDALKGYVAGENTAQVRQRAAAAYHQYQHCGLQAAKNLLVSGW